MASGLSDVHPVQRSGFFQELVTLKKSEDNWTGRL